jgi:hypothetical protein
MYAYMHKETRALRALCLLGCLSQLEEVQPKLSVQHCLKVMDLNAQSCCVITVFRVACCTFNVAVVGLLTQGVDTASINQSFKQYMVTSRFF